MQVNLLWRAALPPQPANLSRPSLETADRDPTDQVFLERSFKQPEVTVRPAEKTCIQSPPAQLKTVDIQAPSVALTPLEKQLRLACLAPNPELANRAWELVQGPPASGLDLFRSVLYLNRYEAGLVPVAMQAARWGDPPVDPLAETDFRQAHRQADELSRYLSPRQQRAFWEPVWQHLLQSPPDPELARDLARSASSLLYAGVDGARQVIPFVRASLPQSHWRLDLAQAWSQAVDPRHGNKIDSQMLAYPESTPCLTSLMSNARAAREDLSKADQRRLDEVVFSQILQHREDPRYVETMTAQAVGLASDNWRFLVDTLKDQPEGHAIALFDRWTESLSDWPGLQKNLRVKAASRLHRKLEEPEQQLVELRHLLSQLSGMPREQFLSGAVASLPVPPPQDAGAELRWARKLLPEQPQDGSALLAWGPPDLVQALIARVGDRIGGDAPWQTWIAQAGRQFAIQGDLERALDQAQAGGVEPYQQRRFEMEQAAAALASPGTNSVAELRGGLVVGGVSIRKRA